MSTLYLVGRVLLVALFVISGVGKLMDIPGTAAAISAQVPIPEGLAGFAKQLEATTGMPITHLAAIAVALMELLGALLIIFNFGTRLGAVLLIMFTVVATGFFHDFWSMQGEARAQNLIQFEKNLAVIGGLLILFVLGPWRPRVEEEAMIERQYRSEPPV